MCNLFFKKRKDVVTVKGIEDLVQVSIRTNERDIEFTSFKGHIVIKQSLDGETSSVVVTQDELNMLQAIFKGEMPGYMDSILNRSL
ncbi:putative cytoplasmic protein [Bacillus cereus]|jgi:hypothetical protein|uniref:Hypothetical cytosolic protein n=1 Tax=Bacillus cereus (strain ATCC 14579 / DSM 31 / CCUG 7414 / JCM 2152 / NBRC 15305 / NCIMB 9373 / NCTC 2599 / NRRL B-3711) TaxID=226900 RepID=Q814E9_BACCR|nr:hypothetical protein [Bacillus cereus]AAP12347.1 hypothetical cytosolic protein [Bacillus cereus ATCC 14579]OOR43298.1 cytoplasmic protein [Bacillus cereus]SPT90183.1 putative cytoplasmic protein [Bacillus cereus]